jgi:hypothetical protein
MHVLQCVPKLRSIIHVLDVRGPNGTLS